MIIRLLKKLEKMRRVASLFMAALGTGGVFATDYVVNVDASGMTAIVLLQSHTSASNPNDVWRCEFSYDAYSESWIEDVQIYGYAPNYGATGTEFSGDSVRVWQSLLKSNGRRVSNLNVTAYESKGGPLTISAICAQNTTGSERSFRARLTAGGDYLTVKQSAKARFEVVQPAKDGSGQYTATIGADGGAIMVSIKNNLAQSFRANITPYNATAPYATGSDCFVAFSGSNEFAANSENSFVFTVSALPSGTTSRDAYIGFRNTDVSVDMDIVVRVSQRADSTPQKVTVSFNSNGGSSCGSKQYTVGGTYGTLPEPTKSNSTFGGWYSDSALTKRVYASTMVSSSVTTLYAKWDAAASQTVTVSFNSNGGSACSSRQYTVGDTYGTLPDTTKVNCTFEGWFSDSSLTRKIEPTSIVSATVSTLYAKWYCYIATPCLYVNWDSFEGSAVGLGNSYPCISATDFFRVISNTGWEVESAVEWIVLNRRRGVGNLTVGFTIEANTSSTERTGEILVKRSGAGNGTLGCRITIVQEAFNALVGTSYKVTFDLNGGMGGTMDVLATYGNEMPPITPPTRYGCVFGGYYTGKNGTGTRYYNTDGTSAKIWDKTNEATLYAEWIEPTFVINDGVLTRVQLNWCTTVVIPDKVTSVNNYVFANFDNSDSEKNRVMSVKIPNSVTNIGDCAFGGLNGVTSIIVASDNANYKSVDGLLLSKDGKTLVQGVNGNVVIPNGVTRIGAYAFSGCYQLVNVTIPNSVTNIEDYAFECCRGLASVTIPVDVTWIGKCAFNCCSGLTRLRFEGNAPSVIINDLVYKTFESINPDCTVYVCEGSTGWGVEIPGTWQGMKIRYQGVASYTVTFNANGGSVSPTSRKVNYNATVGDLPTPTWSGHTFKGWFTEKGGGTKIDASYRVTKALTFYAQWTANASTYILRLHRNNSKNDGSTAGRTYTIGKARALPKIKNELKWAPRTGYDFLGWARSATATTAQYTDGQSLKDLTKTAGATVHLYAVWQAHKYIVRLHRNNSVNDGATTGRAFDYDQVRFLPTMAELKWVRTGYMFLGWSQAQSSVTVKYADGLNVYNLSAKDGEELHVWGVWKKAPTGAYLLRLHRNNSERDGATAGRQLMLNTYRKLPTVKELGWTGGRRFLGWATTAKNAAAGKVAYTDGRNVRNLSTVTGATVHLYAVWE